jgi:hypothetical protein
MRIAISFLILSLVASCSTRKPQGYAKTFRDACVKMDEKSWSVAAASWQVLLKTDPDNPNLNYKLGQCYFMMDRDSLAAFALEKSCSVKFSRSYDPYDYAENNASFEAKLLLGKAYARNNRLSSAKRVFDELSEDLPEKHRASREVRYEANAVDAARTAFSDDSGVRVSAMGWDGAYAPCPSIDGSILYMGLDGKVAVSRRETDGAWSAPETLPSSFDQEFPGYMRPDATELWTVRSGTVYSVSGDLREILPFKGERVAWSGETAYVSRQTPQGSDVFVVSGGTEKPFKHNTRWDDDVAGISVDGSTLYVASDRPGTMGMRDIFAVDVKSGRAANMGYPVNSTRDDLWYSPSGGGVSYMSSDRGGKFRIYRCESADSTDYKVIRGFVNVIGKSKEVRVKAPGLDVTSPDGSFIYVAGRCQKLVIEYDIDGARAGTDTVSTPCGPGYEEVILETYLMPYVPKPIQSAEAVAASPEVHLAATAAVPPPPKRNMPAWFADTEYDPENPVQFQYSDTMGVAMFERYFTYGGQEFSAAETRFAQFVGAVGVMSSRGTVEISVGASASRVPSRRYASNEDLSKARADNARKQVTDALALLGYAEGTDYVISQVTHDVGGKPYRNDAQASKEAYERHQYVKLKATIRK